MRPALILSLLSLTLFWSPACAPEKAHLESSDIEKVLILTDTTSGNNGGIEQLRDSLYSTSARVMVSGEPGETATTLGDRLPWLLQPGVDAIYYDERLAGIAGMDSLRARLEQLGHPATIYLITGKGVAQSPLPKAQ